MATVALAEHTLERREIQALCRDVVEEIGEGAPDIRHLARPRRLLAR